MNIQDVKRNYERMTDNEFIHFATENAQGLRPEAFALVEEEILRRKLDISLFDGVLAQNKTFSEEEIKSYAELVRDLPCPICNTTDDKLNGTMVHTLKSFIVFSYSQAEPLIGCSSCLDKANNRAILSTALLGWWGIPWGVIKTPIYIFRNLKAKTSNKLGSVNEVLLSYVLTHIGQLEAYKDKPEELRKVIARK